MKNAPFRLQTLQDAENGLSGQKPSKCTKISSTSEGTSVAYKLQLDAYYIDAIVEPIKAVAML